MSACLCTDASHTDLSNLQPRLAIRPQKHDTQPAALRPPTRVVKLLYTQLTQLRGQIFAGRVEGTLADVVVVSEWVGTNSSVHDKLFFGAVCVANDDAAL